MTSITLRDYRSADLDALFHLDELCFDSIFRFDRATIRRFAQSARTITLVAEHEQDRSIAGFLILEWREEGDRRMGYIATIDVAPALRKQGLGTRILAAAEARCAAAGILRIGLHVHTRNHAAIRFYERHAYQRQDLQPNFYGPGVDAWLYRKALTPGP